MRILELRELSFNLWYLPLVYPTFFMRLSFTSVVFVSGAIKVGISRYKVLYKILPEAGDFLQPPA